MGLKVFAALVNKETLSEEDAEVVVTSGGDAYFKNIYGTANPNIKGRLVKDIDLGGIDSEGTVYAENAWTPIGSSSNKFNGTFDGGDFGVKGLYVSGVSYAGLFGYTDSDAKISNLGVSGSVSGTSYNGGVVAYNYGDITSCYNTSDITNGNMSSAGGGVVGYNYGDITNCYNIASINNNSSLDAIGGVAGYNYGSITNCYNTGNIIDGREFGGVAGYNYGTVTNCFNTGGMVDCGADGGCVVGYNYGALVNCYWNNQISSIYKGVDGDSNSSTSTITGMSITEMQAVDFVTLLNNNADTYNNEESPSVAACAWVYNENGYPLLNFGVTPVYSYTLSSFSSTSYPDGDIWYISDNVISSNSLFEVLEAALETAYNEGKKITVIFSNLESLVANAFEGCKYLTSISLPSATEIGGYAFALCSNLTSVSLPSATTIEASVFAICSNLTSISLPSATIIEASVFDNCSNLTSLSLPSATEIGEYAFFSCTSLSSLDLGSTGSGITSIGSNLFGEDDITIPSNIDLTIKISSESTYVEVVDGNTLKYYDATTSATFKSITVVDND